MAKEYIERAEAKAELLSLARCIKHPEHLMTEDAMCVLDGMKAADVVEVRQGEWVVGKDHGEFGEAKCTACGGILLVKWSDRLSEYRYCPNCGARMDGDG